MSRAHVVWTNGGEAHVLSIAENAIVLRSTVPAPPGSRLEGTLSIEGFRIPLRIKVHASRRDDKPEIRTLERSERADDQPFVLRGRPLDLTRETRQRLKAMLVGGEP